MRPSTLAVIAPIVAAFYAATGLAFHLIAYGAVDWTGAFVYVAMAFWPVLLAWEVLKIVGIVLLVVLVGIAAYALLRGLLSRPGGRGV